MGYLWAVRAAFIYHWRILTAGAGYLTGIIGVAPYGIALAWMAAANGDPSVVLHISAGVFLMFSWNFSVARIGFSLQYEMRNGTLELNLVSRTPLMIVVLAKAMAVVALAPLTGLVGFAAVVIVSQSLPHSPNPAAVLVSVGVGMVTILGVGFLSAPIAHLSRLVPITHGLAAFRQAVTGAEIGAVASLLAGELAVALSYGLVGYLIFRLAEMNATRLGSLAQEIE